MQFERNVPILRPGGQQVDFLAVALQQHALERVGRVRAVIVVGRVVHLRFPERRETGARASRPGGIGIDVVGPVDELVVEVDAGQPGRLAGQAEIGGLHGLACQPPVSTAWPSAVPSRLMVRTWNDCRARASSASVAQPRLPERIDRIQLGTLADLAARRVFLADGQQVECP